MIADYPTRALIYPYGQAGLQGVIKQQVGDFQVTEQLGFPLKGIGEHLYLFVQKCGLTTHQLIHQLTQATGIQARHAGYAGLKDKHAITRQWISLHLPGARTMPSIADSEQFQILDAQWHDRKLRVGAHQGNRFDIIVRNVEGYSDDLQQLLVSIKQQGFANYFGKQRFGRRDNVAQGLQALNKAHTNKRLSRSKKSLYLSALRSELFNRVLSTRIGHEIWSAPINGDLFMLNGSHSIFNQALDGTLTERYRQHDIHCAISLFGMGDSRLTGEAAVIEQLVLDESMDIRETLLQQKIKRSYRANRALAHDLRVDFQPERAQIRVQVGLDSGVYMTSLLNHFVDIDSD